MRRFRRCVAQNVTTPEAAAGPARRLREIGMHRVLYGTDSAQGDNVPPREAVTAFLRLPLTEGEFAQIAANEAPWLR